MCSDCRSRDDGERHQVKRVPVALDDLIGNGRGLEAELGEDFLFNRRRQMRVRPDRAGDLADAHLAGGKFQPLLVTPVLLVPNGQLPAESDGLGVHPVCAADHRRVLEFERALLEHLTQPRKALEQDFGSLADHQRLGGIHDVVRGEPEMQVPGLAAHVLGNVGCEGDDVVLDFLFDGEDALDFEAAFAPDSARGGLRDQAGIRFRFRRRHFDIEPLLELVVIRPNAAHFGTCVARDHRTQLSAVSGQPSAFGFSIAFQIQDSRCAHHRTTGACPAVRPR